MDDIETQVELIQCNINSNIRYLRAINGLTLRQLGSVSGVSPHRSEEHTSELQSH